MMPTDYELEKLEGDIERITFHNENTGFCVIKVYVKGWKDYVAVTGFLASVNVGERIEAHGNWVNNKSYGLQFESRFLRVIPPRTLEGITKYLGSGLIKGIGPVFARTLVNGFGQAIFDVIEHHPEKLQQLEGIGPKRLAKIKSAWQQQKSVRDIMVFLQSYGIGTSKAVRIYKTYGDKACDKIRENPYRLADDIHGIGFKTADELAGRLGIDSQSLIRANAGIVHVMQTFNTQGHCAVLIETLIEKSETMLAMPDTIIRQALDQQLNAGQLIEDAINGDPCVYINKLYYAETGIAKHLARLMTKSANWHLNTDKAIQWIENQSNMTLSVSQKKAIQRSMATKVSCITGGPGVGKTTVVKSIVQILQIKQINVKLAAPTGRAAKRLSETTGHKAKTIHRLLQINNKEGGFQYNDTNPLTIDFLIVDEASMIDVLLMNQLLKALPGHAGLLLIGDVDQLPSVGPGKVLQDIIESHQITTSFLNQIFRQSACSQIIMNAHRINQGKMPYQTNNKPESDFFVIYGESTEDVHDKLIKVVTERVPKKFGFHPINDIQVLSPMNKGALGVKSLNHKLQQYLNHSPDVYVNRFGWCFSEKDKVIQTVNNYDKTVFNGDVGIIQKIDTIEKEIIVDIDHRSVVYDFDELDELDLAYAASIHKSQGSEYPVIVLPIAMQHYMLLQKNLIYTGITRGKNLVVLIGEAKAIAMGIKSDSENKRLTKLAQRLQALIPGA